ncbi:MAG TPA: hypothetical protein PKD68_02605 [Candidatus Saccharibacteria bacterium]|nr:hypothetical protein [Candidatus Saccharibacteria bacterium]
MDAVVIFVVAGIVLGAIATLITLLVFRVRGPRFGVATAILLVTVALAGFYLPNNGLLLLVAAGAVLVAVVLIYVPKRGDA